VPSPSPRAAIRPIAADRTPSLRLADLRDDARLYRILLEHAFLGIRVQLLLRLALAAFVVAVVLAVPPEHTQVACDVVAGVYACCAIAITSIALRGDERVIQLVWLALFVDLLVLVVLGVLASRSEPSWTTDVLVNGFFVIPMLATTQLRPGVGAAITVPTVAAYLGSLIAARHANVEPWAAIITSTAVLAAVSLGCVLLSWVQRSRVLTIAALILDRGRLSTELAEVETTARRTLAEELHDGALQYMLAARQDLEDARVHHEPESYDRLELALQESTALLRSTVSQLHPSVLARAGLRAALQDLADATASRGRVTVHVNADGWDDARRGTAEEMLYAAARELLTNVVKHAGARTVEIALRASDEMIRLTIADDGRGFADGIADRRLAEGHIGLASQRIRIESAGGMLRLRSGADGTVAEVELPAAPVAAQMSTVRPRY
jgi:two-component system NarL family sensor kinase